MSDPTLLAALRAAPSALLVVDGTGHVIALSGAAAETLPGAAAGRALADLGAVGDAAAALADGARQPGTDSDGEQATVEDGGRTLRLAARPLATGADGAVLLTIDEAPLDPQNADEATTLEAQARTIETVSRVNALLAAELDPERLVQAVVDAGRKLTGAAYAAFFYTPGEGREGDRSGMLYALSGAPREAFAGFPAIQATPLFAPTFEDGEVVRSADVLTDSRYGRQAPIRGLPEGHLPVRSYLAVPVRARENVLVGALLFGHPEPGVFDERAERIATGLADQAAIGLQNARLYQDLHEELAERKRTEAALRTSEEQFRHLILALPAAVYTTDREGNVTLFNERAAALWGRRPDIGTDPWSDTWRIFRPDGTPLPHDERPMTVALREGRGISGEEIVVEHPDGSRAHVLAHPEPLRDASGETVGAVNMLLDVTDLKRADRDRALLAAIVDSSDDAIVSKSLDGVITSWNGGAERLLGYTAAEAIGQSVLMLIPPERRDEEALILGRIHNGEPVEHFETVRRAKNGREFDASITVSPIRGRDGHIVGASKILRDITASKRAEAALRETEARFRSMTDSAPMMVWTSDEGGRCDYVNAAWLAFTGRTLEQEVGAGWSESVHPDDLQATLDTFTAHFTRHEPFEVEVRLRRHDGQYRWVVARAAPRLSPDGTFLGFMASGFEVHDRKQAETHAHYLAEAGTLIEQALDPEAALQQIAHLGVPGFADWCSISLRQDDGSISTVALAHADPEKVRWGWELQDLRPVDPDGPTGAANVIRTGRSELYRHIPDEMLQAAVETEEELAMLREVGFSSVVVVPMRAGAEIIGAVSFVNAESGRQFDEMDLRVAEEIGRRAGATLEAARLYTALQRSEAHTRALFDATPDVVLVYPLGEDGPEAYVDVNQAALDTYGYARDEMLGLSVTDLVVPGSISIPDALSTLRTRGRARFESVHRTRDGREIPMEIVSHLVREDGRETVLSVCRDVTERRLAEGTLRERERELQTLANSIPQMTWMADASGTILWFNQRWYDYTGTSPGNLVGQNITPLIHPDEVDRVAASYRGAFEAGQPWEDTFRILGADGDYRWFLSRAVPIHAAGDRVARWFGTNTDVTEERELLTGRDEALARLHQSQERHRLALEGGQMGTWEWDITEDRLEGDERVAKLWGTEPHAIESVTEFYDRLVHPDDLPDLQGEVERALAGETTYAAEFRVVRPDGRVRWIANRGRVVHDASGAPARMFGLSFDVTERRESEEALRRKNAEMEQFAYTISHDLKSPLVTITGFLGVLKGQLKAGQTDRALASADRVLGAADRMGRLIEDLLHLSRAGRVTGEPKPVELDGVVGGLADALSGRVREAGGTLHIQPGLGTVLADEPRLSEVVENLLANAVTYGLGGGGTRIGVSSERVRGGGLRLVVEDDGPGVPQAYRQKVFELFQRLDASGDGTGIGLALVARIMDVMGGRAYVTEARGEADHAGARFVLEFPTTAVLRPPTPDATGAVAPRTSAPPTRQPTAATASPDAPSVSHDLP